MLFNSYEFFIFLPITLIIFYACIYLNKVRFAVWWLSLASLFFYSYWNWRFLFLFLGSILFNYALGSKMVAVHDVKTKKRLLIAGLAVNLCLLGFFKYAAFFVENINGAAGLTLTVPDVILPIGISFFTFTQIAFLVDCRKASTGGYRFIDYVLFVSFFPHLVAGPILLHDKTIPQFSSKHFGRPSLQKINMAIMFFSMGLFKKSFIADSIGEYVDLLYKNISHLSMFDSWCAAFLYTFQIYFDFSAYSEMAVGLALLLNVRIPFNFNSPYQSLSIVEFWRRWHISLSGFLRDYLYIPLGGNRMGSARRYMNLFVTMLLGGLWHGSSWTFVCWGALHGIYLTINHMWHKSGYCLHRYAAWVLTFFAVMLAWVFFRSQSIHDAFHLLGAMFGYHGSLYLPSQLDVMPLTMTAGIVCLVAWTLKMPNAQQVVYARETSIAVTVGTPLLLLLGMMSLDHSANFIYFQF